MVKTFLFVWRTLFHGSLWTDFLYCFQIASTVWIWSKDWGNLILTFLFRNLTFWLVFYAQKRLKFYMENGQMHWLNHGLFSLFQRFRSRKGVICFSVNFDHFYSKHRFYHCFKKIGLSLKYNYRRPSLFAVLVFAVTKTANNKGKLSFLV